MTDFFEKLGVTRISMLVLVLNTCALSWFAIVFYPDSVFTPVFALMSNITSGVVGFFIAKSTQESKQNTLTTTMSKEIEPKSTSTLG